MNEQIAFLFTTFLYLLIVAILVRSLFSWFPNLDRNGPFVRFLDLVTEPLIQPVRRVVPNAGMFDLSPMIVIIVLLVMIQVVERAAAQ
ncbi:MAG: YggT family protein [Dehalococcoidia bacterium]|jgi:YggT family protein|uniref:YggT family protein n=1 Tax=Candidatus Amarobacter glycogenicus TaxID=3140699 RepID=UPI001DEA2901|nr:YggT family protein [Dehalococcoidia bacterium]MBK6561675.1 YggT family protein [Dehalococcoidia bacterium]MBK7327538.1 YggT family protein [Dehalococcoidia bacterium]MBK7725878.1 YggT family protein [Dehalococcoidia bacterium]MBK8558435.1 YggT family protein [Dehalococcoidia bacterium]